MSGPCLRYPDKPQDITDDLESFVHVVDYMTLQFQYHTLTNISDTVEVYNTRLATFVNNLFFEEVRDASTDPCTGGTSKYNLYKLDEDEFPFKTVFPSRFDHVLDGLHDLCRAHYRSTRVKELDTQYRKLAEAIAMQKLLKTVPKPVYIERPPAGPGEDKAKRIEPPKPVQDGVFLDSTPGLAHGAADFRPDPFDNHDELYAVFESALNSNEATQWLPFKSKDQFEDLAMKDWVPNRGLSISESHAGKRLLDESETAAEHPAKRMRADAAGRSTEDRDVHFTERHENEPGHDDDEDEEGDGDEDEDEDEGSEDDDDEDDDDDSDYEEDSH